MPIPRLAGLTATLCLTALGCSPPPASAPMLLQPNLSEKELRTALGIPPEAKRVLIVSQSSHLDINWRQSFDTYFSTLVEPIFSQALDFLKDDARTFYSVAEMGFLQRYMQTHDSDAWKTLAQAGRLRIVGGGLTSPDTLLTTSETLTRDYLLGTLFAEQTLGAHPTAAWIPDSFGHSPTTPDVLAAAGFEFVGFGRADGAHHTYEVVVTKLPRLMEGPSTAAHLKELGSADFVWKGPGGGEVLAHYLPVREYCQGDSIDLDGFALGGTRLGGDRSENKSFIRTKLHEFIDELTPYAQTPYLFVPVGCDFQAPRPQLARYAQDWNEKDYPDTGTWVVVATFEDYMRLVSFYRDALPTLERDITPVWTGFYASRPQVKQLVRQAAETLAGVEPFLEWTGVQLSLESSWYAVALSNHHDWITGTSTDAVTEDEQIPALEQAVTTAESAWSQVLQELSSSIGSPSTAVQLVAVNAGPAERSGVLEVELPSSFTPPLHAVIDGTPYPAQQLDTQRWAVAVGKVPAWGWQTATLASGEAPAGAAAQLTDTSATLHNSAFTARWEKIDTGWQLASFSTDGQELLAGASVQWVLYADSGGQYRIGSERLDCRGNEFREEAVLNFSSLEVKEAGPARAVVRATTIVDSVITTIDFIAEAGAQEMKLRVVGAARKDKTVALRIRPAQPTSDLSMGVAGGVANRPLSHRYTPSLWPAVTWVARGPLAVSLGQSTAVHGTSDGALEWIVFRNAEQEASCDDVGPLGQSKGTQTLHYALSARDTARAGAAELETSLALSRPLRGSLLQSTQSRWPSVGQLLKVSGERAVPVAIKRANRGDGWIVHLEHFGASDDELSISPSQLSWTTVTQPDILERDDKPFGTAVVGEVRGQLTQSLTAIRLAP